LGGIVWYLLEAVMLSLADTGGAGSVYALPSSA